MTEWSKDLVLYRIDFVSFQESQVLPWISKAEELIGHISKMIEKQGSRRI